VAGGPAHAPTAGAWLRDSARLAVRAQGLLVFPVTLAILSLAATVPAAIAAGADDTFSDLARYAVSVDQLLGDALAGDVDVGPTEWVLLAAGLVATSLAAAWLTGAFVRSIAEERRVLWPGTRTFVRLAILYTAIAVLLVPLDVAANAGGGWGLVAIVGVAAIAVPTLFADYAIVIDDLTIPGALAASVRAVRARPSVALLAFVLAYALGSLVYVLFDETIRDADEVFPLFLVGAGLAHGLRLYITDCGLIALYLELRERVVGERAGGA
jgi:hypothetical protein